MTIKIVLNHQTRWQYKSDISIEFTSSISKNHNLTTYSKLLFDRYNNPGEMANSLYITMSIVVFCVDNVFSKLKPIRKFKMQPNKSNIIFQCIIDNFI